MTQHVTHLLNDLIGRVSQAEHGADEGAVQRAKAKLVAYITELERKARLLDTHPGGHAMHHTGDCSVDTLDN